MSMQPVRKIRELKKKKKTVSFVKLYRNCLTFAVKNAYQLCHHIFSFANRFEELLYVVLFSASKEAQLIHRFGNWNKGDGDRNFGRGNRGRGRY